MQLSTILLTRRICLILLFFEFSTEAQNTGDGSTLPNLTFFQPDEWSNSIVISMKEDTHVDDNPIYAGTPIYVDFAILNESLTKDITRRFDTALYLDDDLRDEWYWGNGIRANTYGHVLDANIGYLDSGFHTLRIEIDSRTVINESTETDNIYSKNFFVHHYPPNGHYYRLTTTASTWEEAQSEAAQMGGHLVCVNNISEQKFLVRAFLNTESSRQLSYWIGLTDTEEEGVFKWINGDPLDYTNWNPQEPNNCGGEDYVAMNWHIAHNRSRSQYGDWNDAPNVGSSGCFSSRPEGYFGIIEFDTFPGSDPKQLIQWTENPFPGVWGKNEGGNGHYYEVIFAPEGINWDDANEVAIASGGYLATITSEEENIFISDLANHSRFWTKPRGISLDLLGPWIGGIQKEGASEPSEGWQWVSGESFSYSNWDSHQPNEGTGDQNRIHFYSGSSTAPSSQWNDLDGVDILKSYVVEYSSIPEYVLELANLSSNKLWIIPKTARFKETESTFSFSFPSVMNTQYSLEFSDELLNPVWKELKIIIGTGAILTVSDTEVIPKSRFYRIKRLEDEPTGVLPDFKLPLPGEQSWYLTVEAGGESDCTNPGGDLLHGENKAYFSLDFAPRTLSNNGEVTESVSVLAAGGGKVIEAPTQEDNLNGYFVVIDHDEPYDGSGYTTWYLHLASPPDVLPGEQVFTGTKIGTMGNTGHYSTGTHLHFQFKYNGFRDSGTTELRAVTLEGSKIENYKVGCRTDNPPTGYYLSTNKELVP